MFRECINYLSHHVQASRQSATTLPGLRVNSAPQFTINGIDFAGLLFRVDFPSRKLFILHFTCAVVCAVYLELADSLSHSDCLLAIRRFIARRGLQTVIYSDNAKTFEGVSKCKGIYFDNIGKTEICF